MDRHAGDEFRAEGNSDEEAESWSIIARCQLGRGDTANALQAADHALSFCSKIEDHSVRLGVTIQAASVLAMTGKAAQAKQILDAGTIQAQNHRLVLRQLEAKLALAEIENHRGNRVGSHSLLSAVHREAKSKGFHRIARKAAVLDKIRLAEAPGRSQNRKLISYLILRNLDLCTRDLK